MAFLADGRLLARLNLVPSARMPSENLHQMQQGFCERAVDANAAIPPPARHGLYVLTLEALTLALTLTRTRRLNTLAEACPMSAFIRSWYSWVYMVVAGGAGRRARRRSRSKTRGGGPGWPRGVL